jgi:hypothetical protein
MTSPTQRLCTPSTTGSPTPSPPSSPTSPPAWTLIRLAGAVLAGQHDEWTEGRRYLGLDILARSRVTLAPGASEVTPGNDIPALSA